MEENNIDWEKILASEGMPSKLPKIPGDSLEAAQEKEFEIKKGLDDAIETENIFSSEIPLNKSGLPPCKRAKMEGDRRFTAKDSTFDIK